MASKADPDAILEDIQRVAQQIGKPPSTDEYKEHGGYTTPTVYKYFDSFVNAREEAGVSEGELRPNSREELLSDIQRVADIVDSEPSYGEYQEHGDYSIKGIVYRFDTWNEAKKAAGVYKRENHELTREMLIEDMQRVDDEQSGALSQVTYDEYGKWTSMSVKERFESWESACQQADVTRPNFGPQTADDEAFLQDIKAVSDEMGKLPSRQEYEERGEYSAQFAKSRFGSWNDAIRKAGFEPREPGGMPGEKHPNWVEGGPLYYGPNYDTQRKKARKRDDYECRACGLSDDEHKGKYGTELDMHHIKPARTFDGDYESMNALENLVTLCNSCHKKYEHLPNETAKELIEGE